MSPLTGPLRELYAAGGPTLVAIALTSVVAWTMLFFKWWNLRHDRRAVDAGALPEVMGGGRAVAELWVRGEHGRLAGGLGPIHACAALLPLLGLLGTVLGMLETFEVIQVEGTGDPRLMAAGIRQALLTTQAGILAALPVLFGIRLIHSRLQRIESRLDLALVSTDRGLRGGSL